MGHLIQGGTGQAPHDRRRSKPEFPRQYHSHFTSCAARTYAYARIAGDQAATRRSSSLATEIHVHAPILLYGMHGVNLADQKGRRMIKDDSGALV